MLRLIGLTIRHLFPGYFAFAMATGIVSIAAFLLGMPMVAWALFGVNLAAYTILWLLTLARVICYPDKVRRDLTSENRGPGFLTSIAATCILGNQIFLLVKSPTAGLVFWLVGLGLWLAITYALFTARITNRHKPDPPHALHGGWLIPVVSTEAIAVLGAFVGPEFPRWAPLMLFISLCMFLLGSMLYVVIITLIFHRLVFAAVTAQDLTPSHWIDVGAVAITTLSGSTLAMDAPAWDFLQQIKPFLLGFTLLFWVFATWWIPLLAILGVWRHWIKCYPLHYDPLYWDLVFPLGMYTTCTLQLARATGLRLEAISQWFIFLAVAFWLVVFVGLLRRIVHSLLFGLAVHRAGYHHHRPQ